jgi:hypothetical protein
MFTSLNRDKLGVLYYKQFLGKRCGGIHKNCWLDGDRILEDVGLCVRYGF